MPTRQEKEQKNALQEEQERQAALEWDGLLKKADVGKNSRFFTLCPSEDFTSVTAVISTPKGKKEVVIEGDPSFVITQALRQNFTIDRPMQENLLSSLPKN